MNSPTIESAQLQCETNELEICHRDAARVVSGFICPATVEIADHNAPVERTIFEGMRAHYH